MSAKRIIQFPHRQHGAALVIALVFLLIITMVTISNMREVSLESRITGNTIESKRLLNVAESAVRDGERSLQLVDSEGEKFFSPPTLRANCNGLSDEKACVLSREPGYNLDLTEKRAYSAAGTKLEGEAAYYVLLAPAGEGLGESENPEYGNRHSGIGPFRYEVNGTAERNGMTTAIRTNVAFNSEGKIEEE
ncbi:pilus assembly protein PilX [Pseudomonas sp. HMWF032]|uniref:pilus assembly PilX family protein n=1 Tax=Pseudomonas sp. HMWF032 TaxID=2056866 RepID=UPI000D334521|nr:PilX N-terminal domain-containing pilus assembly protein [Pseudomonas sp. HMWF032]PTS85340.1 pilus assembly protein PilX [Pseudomonas sp. HMWF032]PTT84804.1 pilus assembly protein PilX [Pseudomonas sp. HMWF010]